MMAQFKLGDRVTFDAVLVKERSMATINRDRVLATAWIREPVPEESGVIVGRRVKRGGHSPTVDHTDDGRPIRSFDMTDAFPVYLVATAMHKAFSIVPEDAVRHAAEEDD